MITPQRARRSASLISIFALFAAGCGGETGATGDVPVPTGALAQANEVQAKVGLKQMEMSLLACQAETGTFEACPVPPVEGVTIVSATATTFELKAGEFTSRMDTETGSMAPCHTKPDAPETCLVD